MPRKIDPNEIKTVTTIARADWKGRRKGRCPKCDGPIEAGDLIQFTKVGTVRVEKPPWEHVDCDQAIFLTADPYAD